MRFKLSLAWRLTLITTLLFIIASLISHSILSYQLSRVLVESVETRMSNFVSRIAQHMDTEIEYLKALLLEESKSLKNFDSKQLEDFLLSHSTTLHFAFDYGVIVIDRFGKVILDSQVGRDWHNVNFSSFSFFKANFLTTDIYISSPFSLPNQSDISVVSFSVPIFDSNDRVVYILVGMLNLHNNKLLSLPTELKISRRGQLGIFTLDGLVIAHTDQKLILENFENQTSLPFNQYRNNQVVTTTIQEKDETAILAFKRLSSANWIVGSVYPTTEIYYPLKYGFFRAQLWLVFSVIICGSILWYIIRLITRNITSLASDVKDIGSNTGANLRVQIRSNDEVGILARAINNMLESIDDAKKEVQLLSLALANSEEKERKKIATDLHDSVCQSLALANIELGGLKSKLNRGTYDTVDLSKKISSIQETLTYSVTELRTLIFDLSPPILYELGLIPALEQYVKEFSKFTNISVEVLSHSKDLFLQDDLAVVLFRSIRELLNNIRKHSSNKRARILIDLQGDLLIINITDYSTLASLNCPVLVNRSSFGFGLRSISERLSQFSGILTVSSFSNSGFMVEIRLPLSP